jgi:multidrug efflux system membrane fusion protein
VKRNVIIALLAVVFATLAGGGFWYFKKLQPATAIVPVPAVVPVVAATITAKDVPICAASAR